MRKGWEYKRFTEVCDVTYGYAFDSKCFTDNPEDTPLIRIRDVKRGFSETFYNGEIPDGYKVMEGDYLVGMDGEFNIGQWGKRPGVLNQRVCKMNSSSSELINQYMYYFMKVCLKSIEDETPFVTVKHLSAKRINQIQIPLPPLSTQLAIVSELDKINELIRLKKEQLKDFDNLAQSLFYEMFGDPVENEKGWEVSSVENVCSSIVRGPFGSALKKEFFVEPNSNTYKVYEQKHAIQKDAKIGSYYVTEEKFKELSRFEVKSGDIIMSCSGTIGELFIIPPNAEKGLMNQALLKFTLNNQIYKRFFLFLMDCVKKDFTVRGTGLQNIGSVKIIKAMTFGLPPLSLQRLFAQRIEQIEREKSEVQKSIQDLETLLASRMQYWFE